MIDKVGIKDGKVVYLGNMEACISLTVEGEERLRVVDLDWLRQNNLATFGAEFKYTVTREDDGSIVTTLRTKN